MTDAIPSSRRGRLAALAVLAVVAVIALVYLARGRGFAPGERAQARGAALATASGCVGCHTPARGPPLSGQLLGTWLAPNVTPDSVSGIGAWSRDDVYRYLRTGSAPGRAQAGGPMAAVVESFADSSDAAVRALADWLRRQPAHRDPADVVAASARGEPFVPSPTLRGVSFSPSPDSASLGARLFAGACATCHGADGAGTPDGYYPPLLHNSAVGRRTPYNLLAAILFGVQRYDRRGVVMMPSVDGRTWGHSGLTDDELAALANFIVRQFGDPAAASITSRTVDTARSGSWASITPPVPREDSTTLAALGARGQLFAVGGGPGGARTACFRCHGHAGEGDAAAAFPRLAGIDAGYLTKQMQDYRSGARPNAVMGPIARQIEPADYRAIAAFYTAMPARPSILAVNGPGRAVVGRGAALYERGVPERAVQPCAGCHGPGGRGTGVVFPAIVQSASYTSAQLRLWRAGTRRNDLGGVMRSVTRRMSDEDIREVSAYVGGLAP